MKKSYHRIIAIALTLMLMFSVSAPVFAVGNYEEEQPFSYYFLIGDSIAIKRSKDMPDVPGCLGFRKDLYAERIADYFNIPEGYNGAHVGWRTHEVLAAILPDYNGDRYTSDWEHRWGGDTLASIKKWQPAYCAALAKADLITVNIGNNNVIGTLAYSLARVFEDQTEGTQWERYALKAIDKAKQEAPTEAIGIILEAAKLMGQAKILVDVALKDLDEAMKEFPASWDAMIEAIREVNPDATMVVLGMYNAVGNVVKQYVEGDIGAFLGDSLDTMTRGVVDLVNCYMQHGSKYASEYYFVDTFGTDLAGSIDGSHLGKIGHETFANKIIKVLEKNCVCRHENAELVNVKAATKLRLGYSGDLVCSDCGKTLEKGSITVYRCQHEHTKLIGAVKPVSFIPGYSGTLVCADCGKILQLGKTVR